MRTGSLRVRITLALGLLLGLGVANGQPAPAPAQRTPLGPEAAEQQLRPTYILGANDQILIRVPGAPEIGETPYRIGETGEITLPLVGRVTAAERTVTELERDITERLRTFLVNPQVTISVVQFRAEPIFAVGAFIRPGIHPLQGRRTLLDTLTALGGLQPNANRRIRVTRRLENGKIPLPAAVENPVDKVSTVEIHLNRLMETVNPAEDIVLQAFDVLTAMKLEPVFVNGEVMDPGPLDTIEGESLSLLQALSLAGGLSPNADTNGIRVLRQISGSRRRAEIKIDFAGTLAGRSNDFPILPNDVLYVPKKASFWPGFGRTMLVIGPVVATLIIVIVTQSN